MMWVCYRSHPGLILGTSFFRDFHGHDPKIKMFQGLMSSGGNGVDTIGKSVKNYEGTCRESFDSWISCGDIRGQRGSRNG